MTPISSRDPLLTPRPTYESQIYTEPRTVNTTPSYNVDSSRMGPMEPNSMGFNQSVKFIWGICDTEEKQSICARNI